MANIPRKPAEQPERAVKRGGGRPRITAAKMIEHGASAENAALCEQLNLLIDQTFSNRVAFVAQAKCRRAIVYSTFSDRLIARKPLDQHDVELVVTCCCEKDPALDRDSLISKFLAQWAKAFGVPTEPAGRGQSSSAIDDLARANRLQAEQMELLLRRECQTTGTASDFKYGAVVDGGVVGPARGSTADEVAAPGDDSDDGSGPDPLRAAAFRGAWMADSPRKSCPDPRRFYLVLPLLLVVVAIVSAAVAQWWTLAILGVLLVAGLVARLLPRELHHFAFTYGAGMPAKATQHRRFWRRPGSPQLVWWLAEREMAKVVLDLRPAPRWLAVTRRATQEYFLDRDSRMMHRFTGLLKLSRATPGAMVRWSLVHLDDGRILAKGCLTSHSRSVRLNEIDQNFLFLSGVGLILCATGHVKVSWSSPGIAEYYRFWWSGAWAWRVERYHRFRSQLLATTMRRHRPDLHTGLPPFRVQNVFTYSAALDPDSEVAPSITTEPSLEILGKEWDILK